ncbi:MAG: pilus assembly protein [Pseudomonadota bacterium]
MRDFMRNARKFRKDEDGNLSIEAVFMLPLLFFTILATIVFFDAFRAQYLNQKATYAVADFISRADQAIEPTTINSLFTVLQYLAPTSKEPQMRVSVVCWSDTRDRYYVSWSEARGGVIRHNNATVNSIRDKLPPVPARNEFILVETWMPYEPYFNVGVGAIRLENRTFTKSREGNGGPQVRFMSGGRELYRLCP